MASHSPQLDRLITALHRRLVCMRIAERAGLCLVIGAVIGLVLMGLLAAQGESTGRTGPQTAGGIGLLSILIGVAWGWASRPTPLAAAMLADGQLRLHDLLSTAVSLPRDRQVADPWQAAFLAMAEARCAGVSAGSVVLHRWGRRAWGSTGLVTLLLGCVALLMSRSDPSFARRTESGLPGRTQPIRTPGDEFLQSPDGRTAEGPRKPARMRNLPDEQPPASDPEKGTADVGGRTADARQSPGHPADTSGRNPSAGGRAGSARTPSRPQLAADVSPTDPAQSPSSATQAAPSAGELTGGARRRAGDGDASTGPVPAQTGSSAGAARLTPRGSDPWQSSDWASAAERALQAGRDRHLSERYRSLLADYFRPE